MLGLAAKMLENVEVEETDKEKEENEVKKEKEEEEKKEEEREELDKEEIVSCHPRHHNVDLNPNACTQYMCTLMQTHFKNCMTCLL